MPRQIAHRTFLISALLVVLLPVVIASGWCFYRSALNVTEQFAQQIADEVSGSCAREGRCILRHSLARGDLQC